MLRMEQRRPIGTFACFASFVDLRSLVATISSLTSLEIYAIAIHKLRGNALSITPTSSPDDDQLHLANPRRKVAALRLAPHT